MPVIELAGGAGAGAEVVVGAAWTGAGEVAGVVACTIAARVVGVTSVELGAEVVAVVAAVVGATGWPTPGAAAALDLMVSAASCQAGK
jgi:hypothetical protein